MFGPTPLTITGGSEVKKKWGERVFFRCPASRLRASSLPQNGLIYTWDRLTGEATQTLSGHTGAVFQTAWNSARGLLARWAGPSPALGPPHGSPHPRGRVC